MTITRRFAILCARCCQNITHDFRAAREILGWFRHAPLVNVRMAKMDTRERWTHED